jgi:hypothetical protein
MLPLILLAIAAAPLYLYSTQKKREGAALPLRDVTI